MISYQGKKTRLRPIKTGDIERLLKWRNDPEVRDYAMGYRFPITEAMETRWIEKVSDDQSKSIIVFAIEDLADDKHVGITQLSRIDWISRFSYLSIMIGEKDRWDKGIGTESMHILLSYAFYCLNLRKIYLEVLNFNEKAKKFYEEIGFEIEGRLKKHIYLGNNYYDVIIMALFKDNYYANHKMSFFRQIS
jgi:UDP-4-amino-4,6-dideoxy-N-acetyl-beta-L-altrosamine N-acetyltransferase